MLVIPVKVMKNNSFATNLLKTILEKKKKP